MMDILTQILIVLLPLFLSIMIHEIAHGYTAFLLGDDTARRQGRLTLNPIQHIDLVGSVLLPLFLVLMKAGFIFGWAKPVPVNPQKLRQPRISAVIVALAGPVSNFLLAIVFLMLLRWQVDPIQAGGYFSQMLLAGVYCNVALFALNILPIPPLDGSKLISLVLPKSWYRSYFAFERYGFLILLALMYFGLLDELIRPVIAWTMHLLSYF